jgi:hypothetical protein
MKFIPISETRHVNWIGYGRFYLLFYFVFILCKLDTQNVYTMHLNVYIYVLYSFE